MSLHKKPEYNTPAIVAALRAHGLEHKNPSQLSDAFRTGYAYASRYATSQATALKLPEPQASIFEDGYWNQNRLGPKEQCCGGVKVWTETQVRAIVAMALADPAANERLHTFINAAAGEGLELDGVDAGDLYQELFPERYAAAVRAIDPGELPKPAYTHADVTTAHTAGYKLGMAQRDVGRASCSAGCTTECVAELHGCASECPALPARPPFPGPEVHGS